VETTAGVRHVCDAVVVALPIGVLQRTCDAMFAPLLPAWKSTALRRLGLGSENKVILRFEVGQWGRGIVLLSGFVWLAADRAHKRRLS
jgi:hypothetical protein